MDSTFQRVLSETSSTGLDRPQMDLCSLSDLLRANSNPMATSHFPESFSLPPRTTATPEDLIGSASHERLIQCRNAAYITAQTELQTLRSVIATLNQATGPAGFTNSATDPPDTNEDPIPTAENHANVPFWTLKEYNSRSLPRDERGNMISREQADLRDRTTLAFVTGRNGEPITASRADKIRDDIRAAFRDFEDMRPATFGKLSLSLRTKFYAAVYETIPELAWCENDWKLRKIASRVYSDWYGYHFGSKNEDKVLGKRPAKDAIGPHRKKTKTGTTMATTSTHQPNMSSLPSSLLLAAPTDPGPSGLTETDNFSSDATNSNHTQAAESSNGPSDLSPPPTVPVTDDIYQSRPPSPLSLPLQSPFSDGNALHSTLATPAWSNPTLSPPTSVQGLSSYQQDQAAVSAVASALVDLASGQRGMESGANEAEGSQTSSDSQHVLPQPRLVATPGQIRLVDPLTNEPIVLEKVNTAAGETCEDGSRPSQSDHHVGQTDSSTPAGSKRQGSKGGSSIMRVSPTSKSARNLFAKEYLPTLSKKINVAEFNSIWDGLSLERRKHYEALSKSLKTNVTIPVGSPAPVL